jgi:type IV pilus assembly protein PilB
MIIDQNIANVLIKEGVISREQLDQTLAEHRKTKENLTKIIGRLGFATDEMIKKTISKYYDVPYQELTKEYVEPNVIKMIKPEIARKFKTIPVNLIANQLTVAMSDPLNLIALDTLSFTVGKKIKPIVCKEETINRLIDHFFGTDEKIEDILDEPVGDSLFYYKTEEEPEKIELDPNAAPIIRLINFLLAQAIKMRASDIHFEGQPKLMSVRFRIDGVLKEIRKLPKKLQPSVIARIKVLASLDIAERVRPQDGRFSIKSVQGGEVDFRISTYSTIAGEAAVIRILDQSRSHVKIEDLGLGPEQFSKILPVLQRPSGMILVCGPTGSGKTTTLYAMLNEINTIEKKIITIEDPVEYRLPLINQIPINVRRGLTFPAVLRAALRQDPDIILVGEIRDKETAEISVQAALTGHLLLSTLHTNSPVESFGRLTDMGVERYYVTDVLSMVVGQRLIRRLCKKCREPYQPSVDEVLGLRKLEGGEEITTFFKARGCEECDFTGYKGVVGIYEIIVMNDDIREVLRRDGSIDAVRHEARRQGSVSMWENALTKVNEGLISSQDVIRFVPRE